MKTSHPYCREECCSPIEFHIFSATVLHKNADQFVTLFHTRFLFKLLVLFVFSFYKPNISIFRHKRRETIERHTENFPFNSML